MLCSLRHVWIEWGNSPLSSFFFLFPFLDRMGLIFNLKKIHIGRWTVNGYPAFFCYLCILLVLPTCVFSLCFCMSSSHSSRVCVMFMLLLCFTVLAKLLLKTDIFYIYISILCTYIYQIFHQISLLQRTNSEKLHIHFSFAKVIFDEKFDIYVQRKKYKCKKYLFIVII